MRDAGDPAAEALRDLSPQAAYERLDWPPVAVNQIGRDGDAGDSQPDGVHQQRPAEPENGLPGELQTKQQRAAQYPA
ncbi:hypothetical protein D3C84_1128700 [compost metagenome]